MMALPSAEIFTYDMGLLAYAAHLWRVSRSPVPPTLQEIMVRDREWDAQIVAMYNTQQYFMDSDIRAAETKKAIQGVNPHGQQNKS